MFLDEEDVNDYQTFMNWLGHLRIDELRVQFGLRSPILEEVASAILRARPSSLLRDYESVQRRLPIEYDIEEADEEVRTTVAVPIKIGEVVSFERDDADLVNRNAILVRFSGEVLGMVPNWIAQFLVPEIDSGLQTLTTVISVTRTDVPRVRVRTELAAVPG